MVKTLFVLFLLNTVDGGLKKKNRKFTITYKGAISKHWNPKNIWSLKKSPNKPIKRINTTAKKPTRTHTPNPLRKKKKPTNPQPKRKKEPKNPHKL